MSKTLKIAAIALATVASVAVVASADPANGSRIVVTGTKLSGSLFYDTKSVIVYFGALRFANPADRAPIAALVAAGARTACARPYDHIRDMEGTADRKQCVGRTVYEAHAAITPNVKIVEMSGARKLR